MTHFRCIGGWIECSVVAIFAGISFASESREQMVIRELERDLEKTRKSLREAHRELDRRAGRIARLEAFVKRETGKQVSDGEPVQVRKKGAVWANPELSKAIQRVRNLEKRLLKSLSADGDLTRKDRAESSVPAVEAEGREQSPEGASIAISYEPDSAVNLEGRDEILLFIGDTLDRSPGATFRVEGGADDSEYDTADEVIAENRTRFLIDYLKFKGIPEDVFQEVYACSTKQSDGPKRFVRISVISG